MKIQANIAKAGSFIVICLIIQEFVVFGNILKQHDVLSARLRFKATENSSSNS